MKRRMLFYFLMAGAIVASSCLLLFMDNSAGLNMIKVFVTAITSGGFSPGTDPISIYLYGFILFLLLNAAMLLTMILIFLFTGFNLNKIAKFYRICIWYLVSAIVYTGVFVYMLIGLAIPIDIMNLLQTSWTSFLPIITSIVVLILAIIFRATEKK